MYRLLAAILFATASTATASIVDCGPGLFPIDVLAFSPDPPTAGKDSTITILYDVPAGVELAGGIAQYTYVLNGLPFSPSQNDLCDDIACPIVAGTYNKTTVAPWPSLSGKLVSTMKWLGQDGELLLCMQITTKTMEKMVSRRYMSIVRHFFKRHYNDAETEV